MKNQENRKGGEGIPTVDVRRERCLLKSVPLPHSLALSEMLAAMQNYAELRWMNLETRKREGEGSV